MDDGVDGWARGARCVDARGAFTMGERSGGVIVDRARARRARMGRARREEDRRFARAGRSPRARLPSRRAGAGATDGCVRARRGATKREGENQRLTISRFARVRETQVKTEATDGYNAVQVGYDAVRDDKLTKPELGHCKKAGAPALRHLEEFRLRDAPTYEVGAQIKPTELFKEGDKVDVRGRTIGKGFQGAVKRYGFSRGLMTHGSKSHRQHGSIGSGTNPGRIYPGKRMHGHMGNEMVTTKGLTVVSVEDDCIIVKGNVPGKKGALCKVTPNKKVGDARWSPTSA